jgi:hypothetical protein
VQRIQLVKRSMLCESLLRGRSVGRRPERRILFLLWGKTGVPFDKSGSGMKLGGD